MMRTLRTLLLFSLLFLVNGCGGASIEPGRGEEAARSATLQVGFRFRSDFKAGLNSDTGWAGGLNEPGTVFADDPFRIRFEVESLSEAAQVEEFRLQYRRNDGSWVDVEAHDFPHPEAEDARTPRVSVVSCAAFQNGASTGDILPGSTKAFRAGAGVSLAERTPPWEGGGQGEFEWALVVRRFADGAVMNEAGDTFEFRMVEADGSLLASSSIPRLRLALRPGHVGGTFVETPGRIGPWRASNGDLYFIMEPSETDNLFMMIKSSDDGKTWSEVDGAHRPPTNDLEAVDSRQVGATIHILHEVSESARYHEFRTSDHPTHPDTWAVGGELIADVQPVAQAAALVVRSDSSMAAFYVGPSKIHYSIRSAEGRWGPDTVIDPGLPPNLAGPQAILGANDTIHLAYYGVDGTLWYRRLLPDGTLTERQLLAANAGTTRAEYGAILPLLYLAETDTAVIIYRLATGILWERRIIDEGPPTEAVPLTGRPVVRDAVDSQQPGADAVLAGRTIHLLFIDEDSRSIFSTHDEGGWQNPTLQVDDISGSWVRGNIYRRSDGAMVYGFIYDAGSEGGAGMNRFSEVILSR